MLAVLCREELRWSVTVEMRGLLLLLLLLLL
jgi:hypothetical protein